MFTLPGLHGDTVSLADYRGRRLLLVFTDPHCGPCDALAPDLVRLHREHTDDGLAVLVVGRGDPDENRQKAEYYGFDFPVALQDRWQVSKAYGIFSTPVGFLLGENGLILKNVARGRDAILALAEEEATREEMSDGHVVR